MMKIKDKLDYGLKPKPFTLSPEAKVQEALNVMCDKNIGSVIITHEDNTIAGILTERDMMIKMLGQERDPRATLIKDVMSTKVRAAREDDHLVDWLRIMSTERFRHLPIVDEEGKLVSMVSQGDFVSHSWPDLFEHARKTMKQRLGFPFQIVMALVALAIIGLLIIERY